ncbi:DUF4302 domain-containing protein [Pedobacter sp. MW01-1-1]|uniref:DUF4302 domain-containing protein n=1 Tax=Pedobacter sp. MW01-1-1 TaxID=3383027 RepID=UPI003FF12C0F
MKNKLIYVWLIVVFILSCKKDDKPIFDDPDTRLSAELKANQDKLVAATNGFKATIYPKGGKGFSFYFKFLADGNVDMMSDINTSSATTVQTSTFRLKALQRPSLIFDTYNYIHLIADPNASISGGANATGLRSDFEFAFASTAADTIKFEGTFNENKMVIVPLTATESQAILAGGLKTMTDANTAYLTANKNPYIQFADGTKGAISIDPSSKTVKLTYLDSKGVVQSKSVTFAYGINKLSLSDYLNYGGIYFNELLYDSATKMYYILVDGTRTNVQNSAVPIIPLSLQFGFPSSYAYRKITITGALPTGVTSGFTAVYNEVVRLFGTVKVNSMTITLISNNQLTVDVSYTSSALFSAIATYEYARSGDVLTLSAPIYSGNWNTRAVPLKPLTDYMLSGPFRINWVASTNPSSPLLGGLYRTADASSFIYGAL